MKNDIIQEISFHNQSAKNFNQNIEELIPFLTQLLVEHYSVPQFVINIIFLSTENIVEMNKTFLNHDYATDVITFDYSDEFELFTGDLFLCPDVLFQNASDLHLNMDEELVRVICHGLLHLIGYNDIEEQEVQKMREQEEFCLELYRAR